MENSESEYTEYQKPLFCTGTYNSTYGGYFVTRMYLWTPHADTGSYYTLTTPDKFRVYINGDNWYGSNAGTGNTYSNRATTGGTSGVSTQRTSTCDANPNNWTSNYYNVVGIADGCIVQPKHFSQHPGRGGGCDQEYDGYCYAIRITPNISTR